ncbi:hypothetical protein GCM10023172_01700 [Hymenobacter ginsengisoli]|uniref:HTH cro/C1-type domain-containing protein n=1 Tax=Hymenobacter ginsengisoli TaxID=1051626 RepID=A0ABP8PY29_9BACT|nr:MULTISPECIES: helix-turn-helix transcriptional regulator [unclassified Hymenobacter]MBO2033564.1 helix-turn-helix transcriptional regulator [Hymenobacter sp. BT559]
MSVKAPVNSLGANIKQLRLSNGFTQQQLATYLDIDRSLLAHIEDDRRQPGLVLLEKLATLYGVDLADLLSPSPEALALNAAFAFRAAGDFQPTDLEHIAGFRRIVSNYLKMKRIEDAE